MEKKEVPKILYLRSGPYELNFNNYNLQEVGLGKAFCKAGFDFDIIYYTKGEEKNQNLDVPQNHLRILWRKGIKILRSGIYPQILKKDFLAQYDAVIASEYSQIMSVELIKRHEKVFIYNGPYYNLFKIKCLEPIYDALFCKKINCGVQKVFCKTQMSAEYIAKKGIVNTEIVGVGLDTVKFDLENTIQPITQNLLDKMKNHRNFLYIGSVIKRKNVELIINAFIKMKKYENTEDIQLVLVGKGDRNYTEYCHSLIPESMEKDVIWCEFIENAQTKYIYQEATVFLLPSVQEIFGMVLLEAMYFGTPAISSHSAGAGTLIKSGKNGIILEEFDKKIWAEAMLKLINDKKNIERLGKAANETIINEFMWDNIAAKMIKDIK